MNLVSLGACYTRQVDDIVLIFFVSDSFRRGLCFLTLLE